MKTKFFFLAILLICIQFSWSQTVEIHGIIKSENDVENIHIINKTLQKFTVTNAKGEFMISGKLNDTLVVSSVQSKLKTIVINIENILSKSVTFTLEEQVNELDEVVIGKMLSGNLMQDIIEADGEPITAQKLGIQSYQGVLKTHNERLLNEASTGGGFIPLNPILNAISGRTKRLKSRVKIDKRKTLMFAIKTRLSEDLFFDSPLEQEYIMDYFYFVSDAENFKEICTTKSDLEILVFLKDKLIEYKANYMPPTD